MKIKLNSKDKKELNNLFQTIEDNKTISSFILDCLYNGKEISERVIKSDNKDFFFHVKRYFNLDENFINYFKNYDLKHSFKKLNINEYTDNPYFKKIKLDKIIVDDNHKFEMLSYKPYEAFLYKNIDIDDNFIEHINVGYFDKEYKYLTLLEDESIWMLISPHEINTMKKAIKNSNGNVVTFGLGLGYFAYMASLKDNVKSVTIIEKDQKTIELFNKYILNQFDHKEKIKIVNEDAFKYVNDLSKYDYCFIDVYRDNVDGIEFYVKMYKKLLDQHIKFDFWIYEGLIIMLRRCMMDAIYEDINNIADNNDEDYGYYDYIVSKFKELIKDKTINSIDDIKNLIKEETLNKFIEKF